MFTLVRYATTQKQANTNLCNAHDKEKYHRVIAETGKITPASTGLLTKGNQWKQRTKNRTDYSADAYVLA